MKTGILTAGLILIVAFSKSQNAGIDTTIHLMEFEIASALVKQPDAGLKLYQFDSLDLDIYRNQGLGNLLSGKSSISINSYSYNGLSTISMRGTSSRHTGIYWNGLQLNQTSSGLTDLSLIPTGFFNAIRISYGGEHGKSGGGGLVGGVHLENEPVFSAPSVGSVSLRVASFSDYSGSGNVRLSGKNWFGHSAVFLKRARNDYPYQNLFNESERLKNAELQQYGLMQDLYLRFGQKTVVGGSVWFQESYKMIPATITSRPSDAFQDDCFLRTMVTLKRSFARGELFMKGGYVNDVIHYQDIDSIPELTIDSKIETVLYSLSCDAAVNISSTITFIPGFEFLVREGKSLNYAEHSLQRQAGFYIGLQQNLPVLKWKYSLTLRKDYIENHNAPFTPAFGIEGLLVKNLTARGRISRNYRVPSFNDLYWKPGGNPDLKPESAWNQEVGLSYFLIENQNTKLLAEATGYSLNVDDWVLWLPDGYSWRPVNIQKVWSRGIETEIRFSAIFTQTAILLRGGYSFTKSTNKNKSPENEYAYKKQLIYIPLHKLFLDLRMQWKGFTLNPAFTHTGIVFTTDDNKHQMPAYGLLDVMVSRDAPFSKYRFNLQFDVFNLFDKEYQVVLYYPMPGRHYSFTVKLFIN